MYRDAQAEFPRLQKAQWRAKTIDERDRDDRTIVKWLNKKVNVKDKVTSQINLAFDQDLVDQKPPTPSRTIRR